ncbi:MAG: type III-B CRISPR module-associated protein Cmr3 [Bacillota bacterium]
MLLSIEPLDTLFFRDGRPFTKEEDSLASSLTWPLPGTIYGALRTAYWSQHPALLHQLAEAQKLNTDQDPTRHLQITGLAISWQNKVYWPLPLDVRLRERRDDHSKYQEQTEGLYKNLLLPSFQLPSLQPTDSHNHRWTGTSCVDVLPAGRLTYSEPVEEIENGFLDKANLEQYLNATTPYAARSISHSCINEPRTGIGLDHQMRRAREGMLYRLGMNRYVDIRFLVECHGLWEKENRSVFPLLRLGGEGKAAICRQEDEEIQNLHIEPPAWPDSDYVNSPAAQALFKLYLATPAIFQNGWLPGFIDPTTLQGTYCGINLQLVAAVVGKPLLISGFDMNHRCPKPLRRAVPAGSVYYFQLTREQTWSRVIQNLHGRCISDERPQEGFGLCFIGRVPAQ